MCRMNRFQTSASKRRFRRRRRRRRRRSVTRINVVFLGYFFSQSRCCRCFASAHFLPLSSFFEA